MKLNNNDDSHNSGLNLLIYNMLLDIESHPAWVCGLKPRVMLSSKFFAVTPCVGVWIETLMEGFGGAFVESHPAWVCGLKPCAILYDLDRVIQSHPAWVCGLKPHIFSCQSR